MNEIIEAYLQLHININSIPIGVIPITIAFFVAIFFLTFLWYYVWPSYLVNRKLILISTGLKSLKLNNLAPDNSVKLINIKEVSKVIDSAKNKVLSHLWSEYTETLHDQKQYTDGEEKLIKIRATIPSETFFNSQAVISSHINVDFFKHLPGIITGIGIIGTFIGLIRGLKNFDLSNISDDVNKLNNSLSLLFESVTEAFVASCFAIFVAIIITIIEKWIFNVLLKNLEIMTQSLDALYDAGAGEEYLAELVKAAQENSTQTRQLKDSLVNDLKEMLTELTDRQAASTQLLGQDITKEISTSIHEGLSEPLTKISNIVEGTSKDQGQAVHSMMEDLLSAFMSKLDDTLGDQMTGLKDMMMESASSMKDMQDGFQGLITQLSEAGSKTSENMSEQLTQMLNDSHTQQQRMFKAIEETIDNLALGLSTTQSDIQNDMKDSIENLKASMDLIVGDAAKQRDDMSNQSAESMKNMQEALIESMETIQRSNSEASKVQDQNLNSNLDKMNESVLGALDNVQSTQNESNELYKDLITSLNDQVERMISHNREHVTEIGVAIGEIRKVTTHAIDGMNIGADKMNNASERFTDAGIQMEDTINKNSELSSQMNTAATALEKSNDTVQSVIQSYDRSKEMLENMANALQKSTTDMDKRSDVSKQIVEDMGQLLTSFSDVQADMKTYHNDIGEYLGKVSDVLSTTFTKFSEQMASTTGKQKAEFDKSLSDAVNMVSSQLQELEAALDEFIGRIK